MSSSSSTSSFELTDDERFSPTRIPWAAIAFLLGVLMVELALRQQHAWFADLAAWQWETKKHLLEDGTLDGTIAVMGSSVLFHGFDPVPANVALGNRAKVVNLALNGQTLQHRTQLLESYLLRDPAVKLVILEFRQPQIEQKSWKSGPYFRLWATWAEFLPSRSYYWEPALLVPFAANRLLTSVRYREGIDNWLSTTARAGRPDRAVLERNQAVAGELREHLGFAPSSFESDPFPANKVPPLRVERFVPDRATLIWLHRFLDTCDRYHVRLVLLSPPAPPFTVRDRAAGKFEEGYQDFVMGLKRSFPGLSLETKTFARYDLDDFCDAEHYSTKGRLRLTGEFVSWLSSDFANPDAAKQD